jgi:PAS domain S-box-containing protein
MKREKTELDKRFHEIILGSVADGVFTVNQQRRITSFNKAAERITGVSASEALGKKCHDVFHADVCEQRCALQRTLASGREIIDVPARILNSKGRSIPISLSTALLKDSGDRLLGVVETFRDLSALEQLRREISQKYTFEDIVGKSKSMQKIFAILPDIAESDATVLIEGPSGSGKELLARAVHSYSLRRRKPMVTVNCGALPESLFESELFGYSQGAFTDAKRNKAGRLALAEGGTLFLDEVSELSPATQVKLLRVLQEREYEPLGSVKSVRSNVRIVAATNSRLAELVSHGRFRDDLYFRLAVVRLSVPSLNERREDIPYLVEHFINKFNAKRGKKISGATPECMGLIMRHEFTGNVRELENLIEYAFVLCHDQEIDVPHLPEDFRASHHSSSESTSPRPLSGLRSAEADTIQTTLRRNDYDIGQTAGDLEISRTTLWRKMKRYSITIPRK